MVVYDKIYNKNCIDCIYFKNCISKYFRNEDVPKCYINKIVYEELGGENIAKMEK